MVTHGPLITISAAAKTMPEATGGHALKEGTIEPQSYLCLVMLVMPFLPHETWRGRSWQCVSYQHSIDFLKLEDKFSVVVELHNQ